MVCLKFIDIQLAVYNRTYLEIYAQDRFIKHKKKLIDDTLV